MAPIDEKMRESCLRWFGFRDEQLMNMFIKFRGMKKVTGRQ